MFDFEKLIIAIESKPSLWDVGAKEYRDKHQKALDWNFVGAEMFNDWNDLLPEQKDERVKDLKDKKWRNIRDNYTKYVNQEKSIRSGSAASKRTKYHFADILTFLKPVVEKRNTTGNFDEVGESIENEPAFEENEFPTQNEEENDDQNNSSLRILRDSASVKKKSKDNITPFQTKLLTFLSETQTADSDKYFLLSLLPDYKQLTDPQKLEFRLNCLNFFKNAQQSNNSISSNVYLHNNNFSPYPPALNIPSQNNNPYFQTVPPQLHQSNLYVTPPSSHPSTYQPSYPPSLYPQSSYPHFQTEVNSYNSQTPPTFTITDIPPKVQSSSPPNQ